ncbi:MAG: hypothetical protein L0Z07_06555 [Planctomycetes bacterium]|nr:hypothetical protein [Planctomycetota bacterium]
MVNEISGVGSASVTLGLGHIGTPASASLRGGMGETTSESQTTQVGMPKHYAELAASKEAALDVAQSAREIGKTLEQAGELLGRAHQEIKLVKNYPPFPAGNEQRLQFINSLSGLKRQLEALTVPAVKDGLEPVFYPMETGLNELVATASDEDVAMFASGVNAAMTTLAAGKESLYEQVLGAASPPSESTAVMDEMSARTLVGTVAGQLSGMPQAQLGNSAYLAKT